MLMKAGKTYRYKKTDHTYLCLFVGETSAFLRRLSDGSEFLERDFSGFSEVKPRGVYERWVDVYKDGVAMHWKSLEEAKSYPRCQSKLIARFHIRREYEEGEGL